MTTEVIAELLNARHTGTGRWQARCPAHEDRLPSLSIAEGRDGRTLLLCRAGCSLHAVLAASGLRKADLFIGPMPSPAQQAEADRLREAREQGERQRIKKERQHREDALQTIAVLECRVRAVSAQLMHLSDGPDADAITKALHKLLDTLHGYEELLWSNQSNTTFRWPHRPRPRSEAGAERIRTRWERTTTSITPM